MYYSLDLDKAASVLVARTIPRPGPLGRGPLGALGHGPLGPLGHGPRVSPP